MTINDAIEHLKRKQQDHECFDNLESMNEGIRELLQTEVPRSPNLDEGWTKPEDYHTLEGFLSNSKGRVVLGEYAISCEGHWLNQSKWNGSPQNFSTRLCSLVAGNLNEVEHFGKALHNELIISGYRIIDCQEYCLRPEHFKSGTDGKGTIGQRLLLGKKDKWITFFKALSPNQEVIFVYKRTYEDFKWLVQKIGDDKLTAKWNQLNKRCITMKLELEIIVEKL